VAGKESGGKRLKTKVFELFDHTTINMETDLRLCLEKSSTSSKPMPFEWAALHASVIAVCLNPRGHTLNPFFSPNRRTIR